MDASAISGAKKTEERCWCPLIRSARTHGRRAAHEISMLLAPDEGSSLEVQGRDGPSPFFIICDHAGRLMPRVLGNLGLSQDELERHIAWDIGAGGVAQRLGSALGAHTFLQRYSRLVIDCNRPLHAADSIVSVSERTRIPGNQHVERGEAIARAQAIFHPYHDEIRRALDQRQARGQTTILVAMHSFTPLFLDDRRPWHVGVLYNRDARVARPLLAALRAEGDLVVGDNQPYAACEVTDFSIVTHGERRGLLHVELELRQDLIADARGQAAWAARLARLLPSLLPALSEESASPPSRGTP